MRTILVLALALLLRGGDGIPPRAKASDYAVSQATKSGVISASRIPARQIEKEFSSEIGKQYVVLEVAIYPREADSFEVDWADFSMKIGDTVVRVEKPRDVATPWPEKQTSSDPNRPRVVTEAGVILTQSSDPVSGRRTGVGTYESIGVTNDPRAGAPPPPAPKQGPDPWTIEKRLRERMLPEGPVRAAVAGYLFFPQYVKHKSGSLVLQWARDNDSAVLLVRQASFDWPD